jgi:hypothetical protein
LRRSSRDSNAQYHIPRVDILKTTIRGGGYRENAALAARHLARPIEKSSRWKSFSKGAYSE